MNTNVSRIAIALVLSGICFVVAVQSLTAQNTSGNSGNTQAGPRPNAKEPTPPPLPNDERLLALHRKFVQDAEKLAAEYEGKKQMDKAAVVYEEIIKLVPAYAKARQSLEKIHQQEAVSNSVAVTIEANQWWQDTGIRLIAGKPVKMISQGTWSFKMSHQLGPDGVDLNDMPKGCKLGSLIGVIVAPGDDPKKMKPFPIGTNTSLVADRSGALWAAMCDVDHSDNDGRITLQVVGRFDSK